MPDTQNLDRYTARLMNLHHYERIEARTERGIRLVIKTAHGSKPITFPRRCIKLFPPDEVLIPEWLCRDRGLG